MKARARGDKLTTVKSVSQSQTLRLWLHRPLRDIVWNKAWHRLCRKSVWRHQTRLKCWQTRPAIPVTLEISFQVSLPNLPMQGRGEAYANLKTQTSVHSSTLARKGALCRHTLKTALSWPITNKSRWWHSSSSLRRPISLVSRRSTRWAASEASQSIKMARRITNSNSCSSV